MNPVVAGYFAILQEDLTAARQLIGSVPRISAFHLQQAAEKLVKAILAAEGIHVGADHNIAQLIGKLPDGHTWKADLVELDYLSQFATTFRYPTERGRIAAAPDRLVLERYAAAIAMLTDEVRDWCEETEGRSSRN